MHEMTIMAELFKSVIEIAAEHSLTSVRIVKVVIGRMRHIVPESFIFAFDALKAGTVAEHAELKVTCLPVILVCETCGFSVEEEKAVSRCPRCSGTHFDLKQGKELILETIEGDSDDDLAVDK